MSDRLEEIRANTRRWPSDNYASLICNDVLWLIGEVDRLRASEPVEKVCGKCGLPFLADGMTHICAMCLMDQIDNQPEAGQ